MSEEPTVSDLLEALALLDPDSPEFGMNYNDETDEWSCNYCCANDLDRGIGWSGVLASEIPHDKECPLYGFKQIYRENQQ